MIKHKLFIIIVLTVAAFYAQAQSPLMDGLGVNINEMTLQNKVSTSDIAKEFLSISDNGRCGDVMLQELYVAVTLSDKQVKDIISKQGVNGQWNDIDYADQKRSRWGPSLHVTRIHSLAKSYKTPTCKYYNSPQLAKVLHKALKYWFDADLMCPNWWYNEIGGPKMLGPALLLLRDELSPWEMEQGKRVMGRAKFKMTGQNKVWLAGNILMRALLCGDEQLVRQARDTIVSQIYVSTGEGLQMDNSFHQHGAQMQFGNYGLAYAGTISYWARVLGGTSLAIDEAKLGYLRNYLLDGLQWTVWRANMDASASGRQVFVDAQRGKAHSVVVSMLNMLSVDSLAQADYKQFIYSNQINPGSENRLIGHKIYPRSDYMIHRTARWYASVRMHSERLIGYEMTNRENLQGVYSSDGAMMLMRDGKEYDNIYPVWNWKYLPGTTVQDDGKPIEYNHPAKPVNDADFVGSVGNGECGVSAMVLKRNGLEARKAWFFIDDAIVCLGSGITSAKPYPVNTTVNQSYLRSSVSYGTGAKREALNKYQSVTASNIKWAHHDSTGYCILDSSRVVVGNQRSRGNWNAIADFYQSTPVEADVFQMVINHGPAPLNRSYAYCVLPGMSEELIAEFAAKPTMDVVSNSAACQGVVSQGEAMSQFVFYEPATVSVPYGNRVEAQTPGLLMLGYRGDKLQVTAADPTQRQSRFIFTLNGRYAGAGAVYDVQKNATTITINLPMEQGKRGSSVMRIFERVYPDTILALSWRMRVAEVIADSVLIKAQWAMEQQPVTVTSLLCERSGGGRHDFYSEGDYWWANPQEPDGAYIRRDGETNPDNFIAHRQAMIRLSEIVGVLGSAYILTGDECYVRHAFKHINAWFVDSNTLMNPNLLYAQAIKGIASGRGIGIIDTIHLIEVVQGIIRMQDAQCVDQKVLVTTKEWFAQYLRWLTTHKYGQNEMRAKNNHGTCWAMQVAAFANFTEDAAMQKLCADMYVNTLLPHQLAADGSFPLEMERTKPYGYSLFNIDAMVGICRILDASHGSRLWNATNGNGATTRTAVDFIAPFIADKSRWRLPKDIMYWEQWPVAHPSVLFAAVHYNDDKLFELWCRYDHFPTVGEVVRNLPLRNVLLWL